MRILVVEDEKRIADFLGRGLESAGYDVDIAPDGQTAIDLVHATDYDLITLDMMLPDMDGIRVLEKIRNRKTNPPVLILSARGAVEDRVKGLELGADDYLTKPFAFVELLARVRVLLRRDNFRRLWNCRGWMMARWLHCCCGRKGCCFPALPKGSDCPRWRRRRWACL